MALHTLLTTQSVGAIMDYVLMNTAVLLVVGGIVKEGEWKKAVEIAREAIYSGKAWQVVEGFRRETQILANKS